MRLDFYLSHAGLGTRKEVKNLIKRGSVRVNNEIVNSPIAIDENNDQIYVNDNLIEYQEFQYFLLNKPSGYVSASTDNKYPTVLQLIHEPYRSLSTVGRLDLDTTGLLIITNNGKLNHFLLSPVSHVEKEYEVTVDYPLKKALINEFQKGVILDDNYHSLPSELTIIDDYHARVILHEGKYHQVKRMFASFGYHVIALHRSRMDQITLGDLPNGQYRPLTKEEINSLLKHMR